MKKLLAAFAAIAALECGGVHASPITFTVGLSVTHGNGSADAGGCFPTSITASIPGGSTLQVDPGCSGDYLDLAIDSGGSFSVSSGANGLAKYASGASIGAGNFTSSSDGNQWAYAISNNNPMLGFEASFAGEYLGFITGAGQYGYVLADWVYLSSGEGTLVLHDGAVESVAGVAITAPGASVPEPGTIALLGLAMVGVATARRRKAA